MSQNPAIPVVRELLAALHPHELAVAVHAWTAWPLRCPPAGELPVMHLQEALDAGFVEIGELKSPRVPHVQVQHQGEEPVLFPAGALLEGGAQTRIIATPTLVMPHTTASIDVRCVESGRWDTHRRDTFHTLRSAPVGFSTSKLRRDASSRMATRGRAADQSETWDDVEAFLTTRDTQTITRSLTHGLDAETVRIDRRRRSQSPAERTRTQQTLAGAGGLAVQREAGRWHSLEVYGTQRLAHHGTRLAAEALELEAGAPLEARAQARPDLRFEDLASAEWSARDAGEATLVDFRTPGGTCGTALVYRQAVLQLSVTWAA